jgi:rhamnose utilization protein RhaD (predicted bifunctional aldolase and dehydrogenase)/NAD(P)-dependent dehydrogenase (short-subunit alcohol dehydrogenase family)
VVSSRWDNDEADTYAGDLGHRVYTSRLLGRDPDLVLHGGGNTSVKSRRTTVFGEEVDVLLVKGSGADLADIDESGFACLRLDHVARLAQLDALSDTDMAEQLLVASLTAGGPAPSVEAILHAILPYRFVDHTHADAVVTLTNCESAAEALARVYGDEVVVVPYVMPGFLLARECARILPDGLRRPGVVGVVLMNHGIFTWGDTARQSYETMIDLVRRAEADVDRHRIPPPAPLPAAGVRTARAELRRQVSEAAGAPFVTSSHTDGQPMAFIARSDLADVSQRGPATPDHVIRTKPIPLVGRDVDAFAAAYRRYFTKHRNRAAHPLQPLDPAPRVILDPELGMVCAGRTPRDAAIVEDVYRHTMKVIADATALGGYRPVAPADLFDVEYWDLEQAKLRRRPPPAPFAGEIVLVTGAARGIGRATAAAFLAEGAAVVGVDADPEITTTFPATPAWLGVEADVTDEEAVDAGIDQAVTRFGGLDILVLNAGIFPPGAALADLDLDVWRHTMAVNLDANARLLRLAHPLLRLAPRGGRVVVVGSKNVPAPGPGAAGYSASKAAVTQLARVAALEWGADGIRVNVVHPNAVFDTGLWTDDLVAARAARYGLSPEEYRTDNVLRTEVTSADVARLCVALCGPAFARTTGAQVPVDGGNDRVI